jgi:hypothetical protein
LKHERDRGTVAIEQRCIDFIVLIMQSDLQARMGGLIGTSGSGMSIKSDTICFRGDFEKSGNTGPNEATDMSELSKQLEARDSKVERVTRV